jgi:hypothetical protein
VSFAPRLTARARSGLASLELDLQEFVLDEIEQIVANPGALKFRRTGHTAVHDPVRIEGNLIHYLFITVHLDKAAELLYIETIGHFSRPK